MVAAILAGFFIVSTVSYGQGQWGAGSSAEKAIEAKAISKVEAEKNYPPTKAGTYPMGERDPHDPSGVVISPYPPNQKFDCSKVAHGALVLDTRAKKVFIRP